MLLLTRLLITHFSKWTSHKQQTGLIFCFVMLSCLASFLVWLPTTAERSGYFCFRQPSLHWLFQYSSKPFEFYQKCCSPVKHTSTKMIPSKFHCSLCCIDTVWMVQWCTWAINFTFVFHYTAFHKTFTWAFIKRSLRMICSFQKSPPSHRAHRGS